MKSPRLIVKVFRSTDDLSPVRHAIASLPFDAGLLAASPFMAQALTEVGESLFPGICWFLFEDEAGSAGIVPLQCAVDEDSALRTVSLRSLSWHEMLYADALIRPGIPPSAIGRALFAEQVLGKRCADVLRLRDLPQQSNLHRLLQCLPAEVRQREGTSVIPVGASAAAWKRSLSRNLRGQIRQSENRLHQQGSVVVHAAAGVADTSAAFQRFVALEASGYKAATDALANAAGNRELLERTLRGHAQTGTAHTLELFVNGELVASQFGVVCDRRLYLIKVAFNETFSDASPGTFLMAQLLERLADEGRIDLLDCCVRQRWHARWHPEVEFNRVGTMASPHTLRGWSLRALRTVRGRLSAS
jgi:CelD/BcsL family acetyltransferase involved in cellulose biosynthesis